MLKQGRGGSWLWAPSSFQLQQIPVTCRTQWESKSALESIRKKGSSAKKQTKETLKPLSLQTIKGIVLGGFLTSLAFVFSPTKWSW